MYTVLYFELPPCPCERRRYLPASIYVWDPQEGSVLKIVRNLFFKKNNCKKN